MNLFLCLTFVGAATAYNLRDSIPNASTNLTGEALRDYINSAQNLFRAEVPKNSNRHRLMAVKHTLLSENPVYKPDTPVSEDLPVNFDARTQWPFCESIKAIRDQSNCGGCWAFGAAEAMSYRVCIATKGAKQPTISAQDLLSCCGSLCVDGCDGGYPIEAWTYMLMYGVCTGGNYHENVGCKPYSIEPCGDYTVSGTHYQHNCTGIPDADTPKCVEKCSNPEYPIKYADDKYFGRSAYYLKKSVDRIKQEIFDNGPVEAAFTVYEDFDYYTGGIYQHTAGYALGGHAVKLIGWGVENDTPYWIAANSWNENWGEKGFFRIISGKNECGIEGSVVAGLPLLPSVSTTPSWRIW